MAVLPRRTWAQILTEVTLRLGNPSATGLDVRIEYMIAAAYFDLCTTYHHTELDALSTGSLVCSTSANTLTLPSGCFVVVGGRVRAVGGASILGPLTVRDFKLTSALYNLTTGRPTKASRFGNTLYFDKKPDQAYPIDLYYYREGTSPDFTTPTYPELAADVDEHIIEGAVRKCMPALARADLGEVARQQLGDWLSQQLRVTTQDSLVDEPENERTGTTHTKNQG